MSETPIPEVDQTVDFPAERGTHVIFVWPNQDASIGCSCGWQWDGVGGMGSDERFQAWGNHRERTAIAQLTADIKALQERHDHLADEFHAGVARLKIVESQLQAVTERAEAAEAKVEYNVEYWQRYAENAHGSALTALRYIADLRTKLEAAERERDALRAAVEEYFGQYIHRYSDDPDRNYCWCGWRKGNPIHAIESVADTAPTIVNLRGEAIAKLTADYTASVARVERLTEALRSVERYGADTLSGRIDGADDREWQREAVLEMTRRARAALKEIPSQALSKLAPEEEGR